MLGSLGEEAKAAVPALIHAVRTCEKGDASWMLRQAAILALGGIGPAAKAAEPVLQEILKEKGAKFQYLPEVMVALHRMTPEGKAIAEKWLEKAVRDRAELFENGPGMIRGSEIVFPIDRWAMILGSMGRTSDEADRLTLDYLGNLNSSIAFEDPRDEGMAWAEECFDGLARFGRAGRLAVPRLTELSKHRDPWVRQWASEALERIAPHAPR